MADVATMRCGRCGDPCLPEDLYTCEECKRRVCGECCDLHPSGMGALCETCWHLRLKAKFGPPAATA